MLKKIRSENTDLICVKKPDLKIQISFCVLKKTKYENIDQFCVLKLDPKIQISLC